MSEMLSERELVAAVAGPRLIGDTRESWLRRAARKADLSYRQIRAAFYGEYKCPRHPVLRVLEMTAAREQASNLAEHYEKIARSMNVVDADFYRSDVLGLIETIRRLRGEAPSPDTDP